MTGGAVSESLISGEERGEGAGGECRWWIRHRGRGGLVSET